MAGVCRAEEEVE
jgi:hypothetical protein